jgi:hypothetical protein
MPRGGYRQGGGRKPKDPDGHKREQITVGVHPQTLIEIDTRAEASGQSRGEVIDDAFKPKEA